MKKLNVLYNLILVVLLAAVLTISCASPEPPQPAITEPEIPANFTTYTSEGLFSISYPPDWVPATSIMEEMWEETIELMEMEDPTVEWEETKIIFFGGLLSEEEYYPSVIIAVVPRSVGYSTLDEIDEAESQWAREHTRGYRENSYIRTVVDGRESSILDSEDDEVDYGRWRYLQLMTVHKKFAWCITCGCEYDDFGEWEDDFNAVVRSFRILH